MSSALLGVFRDYEARYSVSGAPARVNALGLLEFDTGDDETIRLNIEPATGRSSQKLPEETKAAGYTEAVDITCFEPVRLPDAIKNGSDLIVDELNAIITAVVPMSNSLDVVVDVLGQELKGLLSRGVFIHDIILQEKASTLSYGAGDADTWTDVASYKGHVRTLSAEARARYMQAGYPEIDVELAFRAGITIDLGKHRFVYAGKVLEPTAPLMDANERGSVKIARCKHIV